MISSRSSLCVSSHITICSPSSQPSCGHLILFLIPPPPPGHKYIGEFKGNLRHGHGKLKYENGDLYEGSFAEGKFHGHGVYDWASGISYEGEWVHGHPQGAGAMTWADGQRWDGYWQNGQPLYPEDAAEALHRADAGSGAVHDQGARDATQPEGTDDITAAGQDEGEADDGASDIGTTSVGK